MVRCSAVKGLSRANIRVLLILLTSSIELFAKVLQLMRAFKRISVLQSSA